MRFWGPALVLSFGIQGWLSRGDNPTSGIIAGANLAVTVPGLVPLFLIV